MLFATVLTLAAAALHAGWNLIVKTSDDRALAAWGQFAAGGLLFLPVLVVIGLPAADAVPFLVASSLVHVLYVVALTTAYHHGDFSFAYPMSRGLGACVAAVGGLVFLSDTLPPGGWLSLLVVAGGLASLARPGASREAAMWAIATGAMIGTYTVIDTAGSRRTDGFAYGISLTIGAAIALSLFGVASGRARTFAASWPGSWRRYLLSGFLLTSAYSLVLVAVHHAPIGYVATLRESSVVIGAAAGWLLLHERLGHHRLVSSMIVTTGLVGLVAFR